MNTTQNSRDEDTETGKQDIARLVRAAITQVPPLNGTKLEVDEKGIYSYQISNQFWWKVPIIAHPFPVRLFPLYEVMAEVEERLHDENVKNIILFAGDFAEEASAVAV